MPIEGISAAEVAYGPSGSRLWWRASGGAQHTFLHGAESVGDEPSSFGLGRDLVFGNVEHIKLKLIERALNTGVQCESPTELFEN